MFINRNMIDANPFYFGLLKETGSILVKLVSAKISIYMGTFILRSFFDKNQELLFIYQVKHVKIISISRNDIRGLMS